MGGTSSARPEELNTFVTKANAVTDDLQTWVTKLTAAFTSFQSSGSVGALQSGATQALPAMLQTQRVNALFVDVVREAFLKADTGGAPGGVVTVSDSALQQAFVDAAQQRGLDPALLSQIGPPLSVPPTTSGAIPQDSGFVDDPVCTATGHFLEVEHDVVVPARLAILDGSRWYSSRLLDDQTGGARARHPFGRGWWSWASVRCTPADDGGRTYRGPDGRRFDLVASGDDAWVRVAGLEATVARVDGAVEVRWDVNATFAAQRWRFDEDGRLASVTGPTLGTTTFGYDGDRLVELRHDGGRTAAYEWDVLDGRDRIVALHLSDGRSVVYEYDERGDLGAVRRATGDRRYTCDPQGRIVAVHDADDVRLCFNTYDDDGRVLMQVSPLGRETVFQYLAGRLTRVSDTADGPVAVFEHDHLGRMVGLIDAEGHRFSRAFDERGRVEAQQSFDGSILQRSAAGEPGASGGPDELGVADDDGRRVEITSGGTSERWTYDELDRVVEHERAGGRLLRYDYDGDSLLPSEITGPLGWSTHHEWDDGIPVAVIDADGVAVRFEHDGDGNLVATVDALGQRTVYEWHPTGRPAAVRHPDGAEQRLVWDDGGRLTALVDPAGHEIRFEHTAAGRLRALVDQEGARTEIVHGEHGFATATIDALGTVTEWRRDQFEHLTGITNPDGAKWELAYSHLGQLSLINGPDGSTWSSVIDAEGRLTELVDPLGGSRSVAYDEGGRAVSITDELGHTTSHAYDEVGNLSSIIDPLGATRRQTWDALDRLTSITDADGVEQTIGYTAAGRIASLTDAVGHTTSFEHDAAGRTIAVVDATGGRWETRYDERGRVASTTTAAGVTTSWSYSPSGVVESMTRGGATWSWRHDRCGRVVAAIDPLGATARYGYDAVGRLVTVTDARNRRIEHRYDVMGNLVATVDPFGREVTTTWDAMRRPVETTDQLGRTFRTSFDANGHLIRTMDAAGATVEHTRDARGDLLALLIDDVEVGRDERDATGRVVAVHEAGREQRFSWSPAGRLQAATNASRALRYGYDGNGRLVERAGEDGRRSFVETYDFDPAGRTVAVRADRTGEVTIERNADGRVVALTADGLTRTWRHDDRGRLVGYEQELGGRHTATILTRDDADRIVAVDTDGAATTFGYDEAGQLIAVDGADGTQTFAYDDGGRLVSATGPDGETSSTYDEAHQLVAVDGPAGRTTFTYDAAGRRTGRSGAAGTRSWAWDALDRLTAIDDTPVQVDLLGRLDAVGGTTLWWDPRSGTGAPLAIGDLDISSVGGHVVATGDGGALDWSSADWRGSIGARDAWGRPPDAWASAPTAASAPASMGLGFLGEVEVDGLVWLRARLYDPATAAFLTPDPLPPVPGTAVAANPYHYGANDPLGMVDPLGLRPVSIDDYNAARDAATGVQWGNIAKVAVVVGGIALTIACPALGPVALGLLGAGMGAAPGVIDGITTGHWDVGAITKGALVGGVAGVAGAYVPGAGAFLNASSGLGTRVAVTTAIGAADGFVAGNVGELYDLTGLPGSDGRYDVGNVAMGTLIGGGTAGGVTLGVSLKNVRQAASGEFVDLATPSARDHILDGDITSGSGGHRWPGNPGKTPFPRTMTDTEIMHNASDIVTDPALTTTQQTGPAGSLLTNKGDPSRFVTYGERGGTSIMVVDAPAGNGIITAFPKAP